VYDVKNLSAELLAGIRKEREEGRLPSNVASGMEVLYHNYKKAVNKAS
jgi:glycerol-3-phosphate O-acyltransferase